MDIVYTAPVMAGLYNILSILLGLAAIGFGIHSFAVKGSLTCCTVSLGCTGASLFFQILELNRRAKINDWAAIEDTIGAVALAAGALLACTLFVNLFALYRSRKSS